MHFQCWKGPHRIIATPHPFCCICIPSCIYSVNKICLNQRICELCELGVTVVESEIHFLCNCPLYDNRDLEQPLRVWVHVLVNGYTYTYMYPYRFSGVRPLAKKTRNDRAFLTSDILLKFRSA